MTVDNDVYITLRDGDASEYYVNVTNNYTSVDQRCFVTLDGFSVILSIMTGIPQLASLTITTPMDGLTLCSYTLNELIDMIGGTCELS